MSEIIETLMQRDDNAFSFTVNTAVSFVNLVKTNDGILERVSSNAGIDAKFQDRDNFILLSIGCRLPLGFEFYPNDNAGVYNAPFIDMYLKKAVALTTIIANPPSIHLPFENYEISLGIFYEVPALGEAFWIMPEFPSGGSGYNQRISMINVPASLNELTFKAPIFAKVLHTLPIF